MNAEMVIADARLHELCKKWQTCDSLALDTEFIRVSTFYPEAGLVQVCDGEQSYLLDPLALTEWQPFVAVLDNPGIVKILHSCSEDLVLFQAFFDTIPVNLFDTQKAAAFLGHGYSLSYQNLVREWLNLEVAKGETRSDWLKRPLTPEQLHYAALDVTYLPQIYQLQRQKLAERSLLEWCLAECEQMRVVSLAQEDRANWSEVYRSLGAAWRLGKPQLGVLRALCRWREEQARQRNKPRSWVAKDQELIMIADAMPASEQELKALRELSPALVRKESAALLGCVQRGQSALADLVAIERPLTPDARKTIKRLQQVVRDKAEALGMAEELLARKRHLIAILQAHENGLPDWPAEIGGWQRTLLEAEFRERLKNDPA